MADPIDAFLDLPTHRLRYRIEGAHGAPWLTFCNSLGTDLRMWDPQVAALCGRFRILRYDRRGHGGSTAPPGPYAIGDLGGDVLALWDALGIARSHYCGLSIGGLTAQWLALHAAHRLDRVAACATAARIGTPGSWQARIAQVRAHGLDGLLAGTRERWFTAAFAAAHADAVDDVLRTFRATGVEGYAGCCHAVGEADFRDRLHAIGVPLLAVAGDDDPVCPPSDLRRLAEAVADGRFVSVPGRHLCNLESPERFNAALAAFLG
ncbi:3-oxoadipate enol-lactonase [Luteimonas huabeiensis]|uniref:3-oxoadipate enol-lactonase n=1 Tax=Luteimonas huabeiensis TaxID=1244513 RepID=UPI000466361B|nr:3-oxoadipate enol-lactonase [Luteimonas huabeiensis]